MLVATEDKVHTAQMKTKLPLIHLSHPCLSSLLRALALSLFAWPVHGAMVTMRTPTEGDTQYYWNSKYGDESYTPGGTSMGVYLDMGGSYGNDYTVGIFEVPIASIVGGTLTSATLHVYSNGFNTNYYYGSADVRWIAPTMALTGNPVTDDVGSIVRSSASEYELWDSSRGQGAGWFSFDVTAHVQADLTAVRQYSTYVLNGSRETYGSLRTAEYGAGEISGTYAPYITAISSIPEISTFAYLGLAVFAFLALQHRKLNSQR